MWLQLYNCKINADIPPLDSNILRASLPAEAGVFTVQPHIHHSLRHWYLLFHIASGSRKIHALPILIFLFNVSIIHFELLV